MTETEVANLALAKIGEPLITDIDDTTQKAARYCKLLMNPTRREVLREHFWAFANRVRQLFPMPADAFKITGTLTGTGANGRTIAITVPPLYMLDGVAENGKPVYQERTTETLKSRLAYDGAKWILTAYTPGTRSSATDHFWHSANTGLSLPEEADWDPSAQSPATGVPLLTPMVDPEIVGWVEAYALPSNFVKIQMLFNGQQNKIDRFDMRLVNGKRAILTQGTTLAIFLRYVEDVSDPTEFDPLFLNALSTLLAAKLARPVSGNGTLENQLMQIYHKVDLPAARTADAHDLNSNENHPLREFLQGSLTAGYQDYKMGEG